MGSLGRVRRVVEGGRRSRARQPARAFRKTTVCLAERSSHPKELAGAGARWGGPGDPCDLLRRTAWRSAASRRGDLGHVAAFDGASGLAAWRLLKPQAPQRPAVVRYEWPCPESAAHERKRFAKLTQPGHAVNGDRSRGGKPRRLGWEYCHSVGDDCSSWPTANRTTTSAPRPSPRSPSAPSTGSSSTASPWSAFMTDNAFTHPKNESLRPFLRPVCSTPAH